VHCTTLEKMGVPTVPIVTEVFDSLGRMYAGMAGMPRHRLVNVPHPISRVPASRCREYVEGNDPVTGKPVIDEIVDALTRPLSSEDTRSGSQDRPEPTRVGPNTEENLHKKFMENIWTDYLPIVLPTEERVAAMLKGTSHEADEVVGELRSGYEACIFTVENVAANAVMAGAKPEYMPIILALAGSGIPAISTSTQSFARMLVVNGPIRKELGMNSGTGALSPMNRANAVIGRVATLISINLGAGGVPNKTYWGSQGNATDYNHVTFAENEEALPEGWQPFHVQMGFAREESSLSIFHGYSIWHWKDTYEHTKIDALLNIAGRPLPSSGYKSGASFLLDPIVAADLVREGFPTKQSVIEHILERALIRLGEFWQYHLVESFGRTLAQKGIEPYASWLKLPDDTLISRYRGADEISVLVVGGRTNDFWQAGDFHLIGSFSVDEWR
jgi:hypothetical protein